MSGVTTFRLFFSYFLSPASIEIGCVCDINELFRRQRKKAHTLLCCT